MMCACGADDGVLYLIIRQMFRKLRFQMIDYRSFPWQRRTIGSGVLICEGKLYN